MKKVYLKDLKPDEVTRRLKAGEVVKYPDSNLEIKMIDGVLCRFTKHEIVYGTYLTVCTYGTGYSEYYFEEPEELKLEVGKCYRTRDGRKAFIFVKDDYNYRGVVAGLNSAFFYWDEQGKLDIINYENEIVSEWSDEDVAKD